jgi:hypothetical protein
MPSFAETERQVERVTTDKPQTRHVVQRETSESWKTRSGAYDKGDARAREANTLVLKC